MSTALQQQQAPQALMQLSAFTEEQIALLKEHYAKGATHLELSLFMGICQRTGLDPLKGQCHYVKRGGRFVFQTSIDGFRSIAVKTNQYAGQVGPWWCASDGRWVDAWLEPKTRPMAARVGVLRKGFAEPLFAVALWSEFGSGENLWAKMPTHMLAKVAEAHALRRAFPNELGGLYTDDEMAQADRPDRPTIQVSGSHAEPAAEPEPEPAEAEVVKASGLPRIPAECSMALAEVTSRAGLEEVYRAWVATARAQGWAALLESAAKKRASDFPAA